MKIETRKIIQLSEWDALVVKTYGRHYRFQQQDEGRQPGIFRFSVPSEPEDFEQQSVPEKVNGEQMGVSFAAWLARDPKQKLADPNDDDDWCLDLWWERNFYPNLKMVANDLHAKGLLEAGDYVILIDW